MVLFPSSRITAKNSTSFLLAVVFLAFEFLIDPFLWAKTQGEKESESEPELEPHNTNANPSKDHLNRFRIICNTFWRLQLPGEGRCAGEEGVPLGQQLQDLLSLLKVPLVVSQKEASKKIIKKKKNRGPWEASNFQQLEIRVFFELPLFFAAFSLKARLCGFVRAESEAEEGSKGN